MQHSEGPWHVQGQDHISAYVVTDEAGRVVAETCSPSEGRTSGREEENAHLIAAAPDLLSVCEVLHARLFREQRGRENSKWAAPLELLRKVIAQAKDGA